MLGLALGLILQGCFSGRIVDAITGEPIAGGQVTVVNGTCEGTGCTEPFPATVTFNSGWFIFNPYTATAPQELGLEEGEEAIRLIILAEGYIGAGLSHTPDYEEIQHQGEVYRLSEIGTIYLCPIGAADTDGDSICDAAEARYGTDPAATDTDGDSLSDTVELYGYGGVDLKYWGASPLRKDKFIEIDYYRRPQALRPSDNRRGGGIRQRAGGIIPMAARAST